MAKAYVEVAFIILILSRISYSIDLISVLEHGVPEEFVDFPFDVGSFAKHEVSSAEMVRQSGYDCDDIDVTTEDGYILKLFHIVTSNITHNLPIIMTHGYMDSTDTFLIRRRTSPAIHLAEIGYDVYLANVRGNRYSRRHIKLNPDEDKKFWDFSFHEYGYYDLPAHIDKVLEITGKSQVIMITHSLAGANFMVMGSTRPEYNDKIKVSINMAPIYYQQYYKGSTVAAPLSFAALYDELTDLGQVEMINQNSVSRRIIQKVCTALGKVSYILCLYTSFFPVLGYNPEQIEPELIPEIVGHYFAGASVKTIAHASQFVNKHFGYFDYGPLKNKEMYRSLEAPIYNLTKISCKVVIMVGKNDFLSTIPDGIMLRDAIPNADYFEMSLETFSHVDFVWGSQMSKYFFPYLDKILEKYE